MRLLLTDAGVTNPTIHGALERLLGKPVGESTALHIPTALHAMRGGARQARRVIAAEEWRSPFSGIGWKQVSLLELTALPTVQRDVWVPLVEGADALLVDGGDPMYLAHWMRESGLAAMLPEWDGVYVGLSAGSMIAGPRIGDFFVDWQAPDGGDAGLGLVSFSVFPHMGHPDIPSHSLAAATEWAAGLGNPAYGTGHATAIAVDGDDVSVASEGEWHYFE